MASSSHSLEIQEVVISCKTHGQRAVKIMRLPISGELSAPRCDQCEVDAKRDDEAATARRRELNTQSAKRSLIESLLQRSLIPPRFVDRSFENYQPTTAQADKIHGICRRYAEEFPSILPTGQSMILCGLPGTGKNHLACAIANHIIRHHAKSAMIIKASEAIGQVKETYHRESKQTERSVVQAFILPDLLILDEIGIGFGSEAERMILFSIVDARYERMKPTLLLSNLDMDGMKAYAGERVIDRMKENGGKLLVFDWESHRGK